MIRIAFIAGTALTATAATADIVEVNGLQMHYEVSGAG